MRAIATALASVTVAGCSQWSDPAQVAVPGQRTESLPLPPRHAVGGWTIKVRVESWNAAPIFVSVEAIRAAATNDARPWVQHELVLENRSDRPVRFADTRTSAFVGPPAHARLLVADQGCGYARRTEESPIEAGVCASYLDAPTVEPDGSIRRTITLFKELPGMEPLARGTYVFEKVIRFRVGGELPTEETGRTAVVRLVYEIELASP